jgi:hypothetical protein
MGFFDAGIVKSQTLRDYLARAGVARCAFLSKPLSPARDVAGVGGGARGKFGGYAYADQTRI